MPWLVPSTVYVYYSRGNLAPRSDPNPNGRFFALVLKNKYYLRRITKLMKTQCRWYIPPLKSYCLTCLPFCVPLQIWFKKSSSSFLLDSSLQSYIWTSSIFYVLKRFFCLNLIKIYWLSHWLKAHVDKTTTSLQVSHHCCILFDQIDECPFKICNVAQLTRKFSHLLNETQSVKIIVCMMQWIIPTFRL